MLNPDVIELLDDPELGGGVAFLVARTSRRRSLTAEDTLATEYFRATGNIQPAQTDDLQLLPDENRSQKVIVIRSVFTYQIGSDGLAGHTQPDRVIFDGRSWDVLRVDDWSAWGFHTAYATMRKEALSDEDAAAVAARL